MTKALKGVQFSISPASVGPTCIIAGMVRRRRDQVERPGVSDITRSQLQDVRMSAACFHHAQPDKRSITLDTRIRRARKS
jgi:hypothetical protein